ncbi:MAG: hypothetical protein AB7F86_05445 [Bdellovibrionales bacterium]
MSQMKGLLLMVSMVALTGCGFYQQSKSERSTCAGSECTVIDQRFKATTGLVKASQLFGSLKGCLELPDSAIRAETKSLYTSVQSNLSAEGQLEDLNAPMLMALTQVAGEMCWDRIQLETSSAEKKFFSGFKLDQSQSVAVDLSETQGATLSVKSTIEKLARSCWGRAPLEREIEKIAELFKKSSVGQEVSKASALYVCTLTLSSTDVLIY